MENDVIASHSSWWLPEHETKSQSAAMFLGDISSQYDIVSSNCSGCMQYFFTLDLEGEVEEFQYYWNFYIIEWLSSNDHWDSNTKLTLSMSLSNTIGL